MKNPKKSKKKKSKEEKQESKIEEEVREAEKAITHRLREILNDEEKEIEERGIEQFEFQESLPSIEAKAPVLERIIQREIPSPIMEIEPERREANERRIDYSPATETNYGFERREENNEEKKYESNFVPPVLSRREMPTNAMRQEFLKPQSENWSNRMNEPQLNEIDFIEEETRLPFEEQKKYKRAKLR